MAEEPDYPALISKLNAEFGGRVGFLGRTIIELSRSGQPCDITRYNKPPLLDVKIDPKITYALMYGAGAVKLKEMLDHVALKDGSSVDFGDIWTINPMPEGGFSEAELDSVDLSGGDVKAGPQGETLREMVRNCYQCKTKDEEDKFLRRFLAS